MYIVVHVHIVFGIRMRVSNTFNFVSSISLTQCGLCVSSEFILKTGINNRSRCIIEVIDVSEWLHIFSSKGTIIWASSTANITLDNCFHGSRTFLRIARASKSDKQFLPSVVFRFIRSWKFLFTQNSSFRIKASGEKKFWPDSKIMSAVSKNKKSPA